MTREPTIETTSGAMVKLADGGQGGTYFEIDPRNGSEPACFCREEGQALAAYLQRAEQGAVPLCLGSFRATAVSGGVELVGTSAGWGQGLPALRPVLITRDEAERVAAFLIEHASRANSIDDYLPADEAAATRAAWGPFAPT